MGGRGFVAMITQLWKPSRTGFKFSVSFLHVLRLFLSLLKLFKYLSSTFANARVYSTCATLADNSKIAHAD